ncbi:amidohydrolase family protein [Pseudalkalibacillus sp. Hm43]|uniref:amidohydrolase family protein n=1 Tax=Pseudalkalibacillus sp. Hm43 TaxID=3450742 RepID=UPI003F432410
MKKIIFPALIGTVLFLTWYIYNDANQVNVISTTDYKRVENVANTIEQMRKDSDSSTPLHEVYEKLTVIDVHSHDAPLLDASERRKSELSSSLLETWKKYGIDRTVLFGNVSEPEAIQTDKLAWQYYEKYPDHIYPSFAGIPLSEDSDGIEKVRQKLEQGYLNIGELFAASTYSSHSGLPWKAEHPHWGLLPEIYDLCAEYQVPILLHIDPPNGKNMAYLKKALRIHPDTIFVYAHANVHNTPENLRSLLRNHDHLYIDFFPGFTRYNENSEQQLADFVPLIEEYSDQFFLGSDSGYEIGLENAYKAMYELIHLLTPETAGKVAYQNYERLIENQPPTDNQIQEIKTLTNELKLNPKTYKLNKREANELIFDLKKKSLKES